MAWLIFAVCRLAGATLNALTYIRWLTPADFFLNQLHSQTHEGIVSKSRRNEQELTMRNISRACVAVAALLAVPAPALAATSAYDGSWNLEFATKAGSCDQAYNFTVNIAQGAISHPNLVRFTGSVAKSGAAHASVRVGEKSASGSGRFTQTSGHGNWSGYSGSEKCSGTWTAQKV